MTSKTLKHFNFNKVRVKISLLSIMILFLMNCNPSNSQEDLTPTLLSRLLLHRDRIRIIGQAIGPGAISNATVSVFPIPASGYCFESGVLNSGNQILTSGKTDSSGQFSLAYVSVGSPVCIVLTGDASTSISVFIPFNKQNLVLPWESDVHYSAVISEPDAYGSSRGVDGLYKIVTISPFTSILEARFQGLRSSNISLDSKFQGKSSNAVTTKSYIDRANRDVLFSFLNGLRGKIEELDTSSEIYRMRLGGLTQLADSGGDEIYDSIAGTTSSILNDGSVSLSNLNNLITYMKNDFTDGIFNGKKLEINGTTSTVVYSNISSTVLSTFLTQKFRNSIHMFLIHLSADDLPSKLIESQIFYNSSL